MKLLLQAMPFTMIRGGNSMSELVAGIFIGALSIVVILSQIPDSKMNRINETIKSCEASLPRDQHCVIVALPVSKD